MKILSKIPSLVKHHQKDLFLVVCMVLIAVIGFNIGKINALRKTPAETNEKTSIFGTEITPNPNPVKNQMPVKPQDLRVVVSKASTSKKYHFVWCPGAQKIKEANKLWFDNESLAQKAGYTLAGNCQ